MNGPLFDNRNCFVQEPPRPTIDISKLGARESIVATDTEGTFRFEYGDLITSPEQFFDIVCYRRAVPPS